MKFLKDKPPQERYEICRRRTDAIAVKLINAIHLNAMCEIIVFSKNFTQQIPYSYAANSLALLQRTLIQKLALDLCSLWDPFIEKRSEDRNSIPSVVELIDEEVIKLAVNRSFNHWYSGVEQNLGYGYEHLTTEQICQEKERLSRQLANQQSQYIAPCIRKVIERLPQFKECKLIKETRKYRNDRLAHNIERTPNKSSANEEPSINWDTPKKLLLISLWCCHNLSLGLKGHDQNFKSSFEIAKLYNEELWHNCTFDIPG